MTAAPLSLEQAPPISVPLRFFLTAPAFGLLAAAVLLAGGPAPWGSRASPVLLAATHLLTLGVITQVMMGAMLQLLPVVAGSPVPYARATGAAAHLLLAAGALALAAGLWGGDPSWMRAAVALLAAAFAVFLAAAAVSLARAPVAHRTVQAMRLAILALGVTAGLGLTLAIARGRGGGAAGYALLAALHPAWGLLGWIALLVVGVAYQVVPMFQITPAYPPVLSRGLAPALFASLVFWSVATAFGDPWVRLAAGLMLALGLAGFAAATLRLQARRRRRLPDPSLQFWRLGLAALLAAVALWLAGQARPALTAAPAYGLALGLLFLAGYALSLINAMLYKIVPFLVWLHLSAHPAGRGRLPNVKDVIPDRRARVHLWLHRGAIALLLAAAVRPRAFVYPAAAVFAAANLALGLNLLMAWGRYRRIIAGNATPSPDPRTHP